MSQRANINETTSFSDMTNGDCQMGDPLGRLLSLRIQLYGAFFISGRLYVSNDGR